MPQIIVIQYSADPIRMEWVNIGVAICVDEGLTLYQWADPERSTTFFKYDSEPVISSIKVEFEQYNLKELLLIATEQWHLRPIKLRGPMGTILGPDEALIDATKRYLSLP